MSNKRPAFNVKLLQITPTDIRLMKPITSLDMYESPGSANFHSEGLFSTEIFGRVGDERRDTTFAYIPLKTTILHPIIFDKLQRVKRLYIGILSGKEFAEWDEKVKDFKASDEVNGKTGYHFFMSHWDELVIPKGDSVIRHRRVELLNKYRQQAKVQNVLVMPAGLRDAEMDELGRTQEDEINPLYRQLISISNTVGSSGSKNDEIFDRARYAQQLKFNAIYEYIENMLKGKRGFLQDKWGSRKVMDGTRNVITAMNSSPATLESPTQSGPDDTVIGLWQLSRGALPITLARLRDSILNQVFGDVEGNVRLIDTKTLKSEYVKITPQAYDRWTTREGLEQVVSIQSMIDQRSLPVKIEDRYLALVYKPKKEMVFKIFYDIDELPEGFSKKDVYPITYHELIYLSNYRGWNKLKALITRYPVTGENSTYPSNIFVRTTVNSESRVELDFNWQPMDSDENTAWVYPVMENPYYIDSTVIHWSKVAGLGAD